MVCPRILYNKNGDILLIYIYCSRNRLSTCPFHFSTVSDSMSVRPHLYKIVRVHSVDSSGNTH